MAEFLLIIGIIVLFCCLVLTVLALLFVSGIFHSVEVGTGKPPIGKVVIAYKFAKGPYKEAGHMFTELIKYVPEGFKTLGIYYDDPNSVAPENLRYAVGAILSENDSPIDEKVQSSMTGAGYKFITLPEVSYVVKSSYPFNTSLSILFAVARVYPKLYEYVKEHKLCAHPFLEVYIDSTIHFVAPLAKQNEFYVEEAREKRGDDYEDDDEDDDVSLLSTSVVTGDISRDTSYMGSFIDDDNSDLEERKSASRDTSYSKESSKGPQLFSKETCELEGTLQSKINQNQPCSTAAASFQDSGFSSEQTNTPLQSPNRSKEEMASLSDGGSESGSSFEEISMETENLISKDE